MADEGACLRAPSRGGPRGAVDGVSRRDLLSAGGVAALASVVGSVLGSAKPAGAQALGNALPAVDGLAVRVVTDSYHLALAPSFKAGNIDVQRFSLPLSDRPPLKSLLCEFGLAWHVESTRGGDTRYIMLDFGSRADTLNNTQAELGIAPERLDALTLTHGHYDHFGGLAGFLARHSAKLKSGISLYLGGEEAFCNRDALLGPKPLNFGVLDRRAIQNAKVRIVSANQPSVVADHAFTTGHIPAATFERVLSPTRMRPGIADGLGCFPERLPEDKRKGDDILDDFAHEIALCFHVKDRGLVVLSSCSHRGIVNTVKQAVAASRVDRVHAVLGGFHLAPHKPDYVRETVKALKELNPDAVMPMHCTGETFLEIVQQEMPGKLVRSYTGSRYVFGVVPQ
jgi:7,8-dihydropterin-6-yl-methyl-4-(beta-D-ribofuranosyl)aminobenzene 5'-phosphate synthase